ncbi:hypothetical protein DZB84_19445 [Bacillus sp. HNG]|uniref:hypothetical protein n=1 Tax=Bacillus sp. HNG TaxID=2293325 RepID=UPI000E2E8CB9|nr:hypothetical protein [Bacillus sp. HNG]RFB12134.1 hypothetical protein DZB84_19445 [Bacillus sp. HNG]
MLLIRHSIGSRLFYQTEEYEIHPEQDKWVISLKISDEGAKEVIKFKEELNLFDVEENQKTWYYSSDGNVEFSMEESTITITADHKTIYPV